MTVLRFHVNDELVEVDDVSPTQTCFDLPPACAAWETESAWLAEWRNRSSVAGVEKDDAGSPCGLEEPGP